MVHEGVDEGSLSSAGGSDDQVVLLAWALLWAGAFARIQSILGIPLLDGLVHVVGFTNQNLGAIEPSQVLLILTVKGSFDLLNSTVDPTLGRVLDVVDALRDHLLRLFHDVCDCCIIQVLLQVALQSFGLVCSPLVVLLPLPLYFFYDGCWSAKILCDLLGGHVPLHEAVLYDLAVLGRHLLDFLFWIDQVPCGIENVC